MNSSEPLSAEMGRHIRAWRRGADITIDEMAECLDVSRATLLRIESGYVGMMLLPEAKSIFCEKVNMPETLFDETWLGCAK